MKYETGKVHDEENEGVFFTHSDVFYLMLSLTEGSTHEEQSAALTYIYNHFGDYMRDYAERENK